MDLVVVAILGIAMLRGLFRGLVREALSIGALAAACVVVRLFAAPAADWLVETSAGQLGTATAPWIAGGVLAIATIVAGAVLARVVRGSARAVGLGWADHAGGAVIGVAEGALLSVVLLLVITRVLGPEHPFLEGSRSVEALREMERVAAAGEMDRLDVAAPPEG